MITVGVDAHKRVHAAVALDDSGQELGRWRGPNSHKGWRDLFAWSVAFGDVRRFGIEGAWSLGKGLAQFLVGTGEAVFEINPRWTATRRLRSRKLDKSDYLDALAIARFLREEADTLTSIASDDETAILAVLASERQNAVQEAVRLRNQLHALVLQLDPEYEQRLPPLNSRAGLDALKDYAPAGCSAFELECGAAVRRLAQRLQLAVAQSNEVADRIRKLAAARFAPLTKLCGINLLTAGELAAELGPGRRFASDAQLAAHAGVSPLEASSAERTRHRLNRGGNRRLNSVFYRIALTQARHSDDARAYLQRRVSQGRTKREAIRALKRHLVRAVWRLWQECLIPTTGRPGSTAPEDCT